MTLESAPRTAVVFHSRGSSGFQREEMGSSHGPPWSLFFSPIIILDKVTKFSQNLKLHHFCKNWALVSLNQSMVDAS